mmetsp:Transcript_11701/g.35084  ORF Transcript_11701/g.35084 Transcript_11701/m.35084 type:complete len:209 (+) Transcript_11701:37-663(+)
MLTRLRATLLLVLAASTAVALVPLANTLTSPRSAPPRRAPTTVQARGRLLDELASLDDDSDVDSFVAKKKTDVVPPLEPETVFFEGPPSWTELILPGISVLTVIGIVPFAAALSRQVWVKYKVTSRRISVQSGFGGNDFSEITYPEIVNLKYVFRSGGAVGDMVIQLRDGSKLEMRHVPNFTDVYKYIYDKISPDAQADSFSMKDVTD